MSMKNNKNIARQVALEIIEAHGLGLSGKALEKAAFEAYAKLCGFSKKRIMMDYDIDNASDAITLYNLATHF